MPFLKLYCQFFSSESETTSYRANRERWTKTYSRQLQIVFWLLGVVPYFQEQCCLLLPQLLHVPFVVSRFAAQRSVRAILAFGKFQSPTRELLYRFLTLVSASRICCNTVSALRCKTARSCKRCSRSTVPASSHCWECSDFSLVRNSFFDAGCWVADVSCATAAPLTLDLHRRTVIVRESLWVAEEDNTSRWDCVNQLRKSLRSSESFERFPIWCWRDWKIESKRVWWISSFSVRLRKTWYIPRDFNLNAARSSLHLRSFKQISLSMASREDNWTKEDEGSLKKTYLFKPEQSLF